MGQSLTALVGFRHETEVRLGDLYVITKNPIKADTQVGDSRLLTFLLLEDRQPIRPIILNGPQLVKLGQHPTTNETSLFCYCPGFIDKYALEFGMDITEWIKGFTQRVKKGIGSGLNELEYTWEWCERGA